MGYNPNMGLRERTESDFGKSVRTERERRGWSQEELAKRLEAKGIENIYASTIAKIESEKKPRAVRLAEAMAIAEVFDVSLDALLGRKTRKGNDLAYMVRSALETARQCGWQVAAIRTTLGDRFADLETLEFEGHGELAAVGMTAWKALAEAADALGQLGMYQLPPEATVRLRDSVVERAANEKLLKFMQEMQEKGEVDETES